MSTISYTSEFTISQPVEILFPLFSPEGEKLWVPNWEYENVMGTTRLQEDSPRFISSFPMNWLEKWLEESVYNKRLML